MGASLSYPPFEGRTPLSTPEKNSAEPKAKVEVEESREMDLKVEAW